MNDNELYERARKRVQEKIKGRSVHNKDVIIDQEKEIEYYRNRIKEFMNKDTKKNNSGSINIKLHLETDEAMQKLEEVSKLLEEINNKSLMILGIDKGQAKDYTTICTYQAGVLVKEETTQYK